MKKIFGRREGRRCDIKILWSRFSKVRTKVRPLALAAFASRSWNELPPVLACPRMGQMRAILSILVATGLGESQSTIQLTTFAKPKRNQ